MARPENESLYVADAPVATVRRGQGTAISLEDEVGAVMGYYARTFPKQTVRLLGKVGSTVRGWSREAMQGGGPRGVTWDKTSAWKPRGRRARLLADPKRSKYGSGRLEALREHLFKGRARAKRPYGKLYSTARYILDKKAQTVQVGWVNPSAAAYGKAVQAGLRGPKYNWPFQGSQPVSPSMRRALAAAGVVLRRGTLYLRSPERPMWRPIYGQLLDQLPGILDEWQGKYFGGAR